MKAILQNPSALFRKKIFSILAGLLILSTFSTKCFSQCGAGYTRDTINWDYLDFFHQVSGTIYGFNNPTTLQPFVTAAMDSIQYFNVSNNRITFRNSNSLPVGSVSGLAGDITAHTGEASTFGVGEDVKFMPYSITFTFQNAVQDVKFSVHDIDRLQRIAVTAVDGATAKNITMATLAGTILTINNNNTPTADVKSANSSVALNVTTGTVNVTIPGSVTAFTITVSETTIVSSGPASGQDDGGFFLSDISACFANPSFPTNYYQPYTEPFTGPVNQPAYFLANPQNLHVYMVNPVTAVADYIFSDPGTVGTKMNSLAYDPVNHYLYYVMDLSSAPAGNLTLKKYDFNTETISTVIPNLATFGIPCFSNGVELAGAAFYNGSLFIGIEGLSSGTYSGVENNIWKIDFDGSGNATTYAQVFGTLGATGTSPLHDWGDIIIKDGIIISHATVSTLSDQYIHYNMQTGTATTYTNSVVQTAGQLGQTYNGTIYRIRDSVAVYNNNGTVGAKTKVTVTSCSPAWSGNAGDASDPFKPKCDFGDAPATYDPVALSPAVHQKNCLNNTTLLIGTTWDREWSKTSSASANADGADEDGISTVTILNSNGITYNHVQQITVTNNTGANATLGAWLDYNVNGVFDAGEGRIVTVPSTGSGTQTVSVTWSSLNIPVGTANTFLRVRLVSGSTALTTSNATGWYDDGEVEDYPVVSNNIPLSIKLVDFNAYLKPDKTVAVEWTAISDNQSDGFEIQKSYDQENWTVLAWRNANNVSSFANYSFTDMQPASGKTYYRIRMVDNSGSSTFSDTRIIYLTQPKNQIVIAPNPINSTGAVTISGVNGGKAVMHIRNLSGQILISKSIIIAAGETRIPIDAAALHPGVYIVEISTSEKRYTNKLSVTR
jgi:guanyl-specific ribonuclease Sa